MPYSIETDDGITIDNIPDNVPKDAATLKERVAKIRQDRGTSAPKPAAPSSGPRMDAIEPPNWIERQLAKLPDLISPKTESNLRGVVMGAADPSVGAAQLLANVVGAGDTVNKAIKQKEDQYEQGRAASGRDGFDAARLAGNVISPANLMVAAKLPVAGTAVKNLAAAGAKAGAVSGAMAPVTDGGDSYLGDKVGQVVGGTASGAFLSPVVGKVASGIARGVQAVSNMGAKPAPNINVAINNMMAAQGMNASDIPPAVMQSVGKQVQEALDTGAKLDPAAIMRRAQFEAVGLTDDAAPTLGQMTRDPMQFAKEKNLSGINLDGQNPLATRFQAQQQRLGQVFDDAGATAATDRGTAGQTLIKALQDADVPMKQGVDDLYDAARGMNLGRVADLDRNAFAESVGTALDEGMLNSFVPANVRGLLNEVSTGKGPFNVDSAVQLDSLFSQAQRQAQRGGDDAGAFAIGKIRDALRNTPFAAAEGSVANQTAGVVDDGAAAREAFSTARQAARSRFDTIEGTPAMKAALDDAAPDKFVQKFILNADARDVSALKDVLKNNPDAQGQLRSQVADFLKKAAFGENPSGDKAFAADRYLKTLEAIGPQKLQLFFSPEEIVRLNLAGKAASDINSIPAGAKYGTNTSGTAAAAINNIMGILERVPGGGVLGVPLNFVRRELGNYQTQKQIQDALKAAPKAMPAELPPEVLDVIKRLGLASGFLPSAASAGQEP